MQSLGEGRILPSFLSGASCWPEPCKQRVNLRGFPQANTFKERPEASYNPQSVRVLHENFGGFLRGKVPIWIGKGSSSAQNRHSGESHKMPFTSGWGASQVKVTSLFGEMACRRTRKGEKQFSHLNQNRRTRCAAGQSSGGNQGQITATRHPRAEKEG